MHFFQLGIAPQVQPQNAGVERHTYNGDCGGPALKIERVDPRNELPKLCLEDTSRDATQTYVETDKDWEIKPAREAGLKPSLRFVEHTFQYRGLKGSFWLPTQIAPITSIWELRETIHLRAGYLLKPCAIYSHASASIARDAFDTNVDIDVDPRLWHWGCWMSEDPVTLFDYYGEMPQRMWSSSYMVFLMRMTWLDLEAVMRADVSGWQVRSVSPTWRL